MALSDFIRQQPGVKEAPDVAFAVAARITAIDGEPIENRPLQRFRPPIPAHALGHRDGCACRRTPMILSGAWWQPGDRDPQVCVSEEAAKILNLKPGALVDWNIWNRNLRTRVACIERTESHPHDARASSSSSTRDNCEDLPAVYYGSARVRPADVAATAARGVPAISRRSPWSTSRT